MPKFNIQIAETSVYQVEVEAETMNAARSIALNKVPEDREKYLLAVDDRRVILVESVK